MLINYKEKNQEKRIKELEEKNIKGRYGKFNCKLCKYTSGSEQGLEINLSQKHKPSIVNKFCSPVLPFLLLVRYQSGGQLNSPIFVWFRYNLRFS